MKKKELVPLALALLLFVSCSKEEIKVACVGDSITEGYALASESKTAYPVILGSILGANYSVINCGRSSTTIQKKGDVPYWNSNQFSNVFALNPDIIVIKLGHNDLRQRMDGIKGSNWNAENFSKDYQAMIDTFKTIPNKPKIFICLPIPIYKNNWNFNGDSAMSVTNIIPAIKNIAKANNLPVIDLYTKMSNQPENFSDGIHPNEKGARIMADFIAKAIKGNK
jgi:acyl-CoA thioesterase-1